jgi:GNAT superfamily N-acetyltransferase
MPPALRILPFESRHIEPAAGLLAARHERDRQRIPRLAPGFASPEACMPFIAATLANPLGAGAAAEHDGRVVGFLLSEKNLLPPTHFASQWVEPYSISIPLTGHAVAEGFDAVDVYRQLYANEAARWIQSGFFKHTVHVIPGDNETQEAWVNLGFGRKITCAVRETTPVSPPSRPGLDIHQASSEDIEVVLALEETNTLHHASSPIFWPYLREILPAIEGHIRTLLADPANAHLVAYQDGKPLGMDSFTPPDFLSPLCIGGKTTYLFQGVVEPEARGGGIGKALLARSMEWAREQGYEYCALHFASANPSGAPFWLGQGFVPVEHSMTRHVDERIAWAH